MIVIADGVPLLSTEPIWRRPGLPFGPSLGPPERFPYDPGPFEPSPSGPDWTVEGTRGIPRARHLEAEVLTCPAITLVADPDPLHTFSGYATTAILVGMRAANNGRVISWGWFRERATLAIPSGDALATAWVEGGDTLMVATYLADAERPVVVPFRNDLPEAGAMSSASMAQLGHGPSGPTEGFLVGVRVLDQWVFLAFHGRAGNVFLLRLDHTLAYTEAPDWTPTGVPGANVEGHVNYDPRIMVYTPDGAEGAPFYEDAYVGPGWLPNLDARTINGHDVVVMAWEHSEDGDLTINDTKYVAVAAFAQPHMGVIPSPITYAGGFGFDVPIEDEAPDFAYFHLAPGIAIAPETECERLGQIRLDLTFFDVYRDGEEPRALHQGALVHARLAWCVPWL